MIHWLAHKLGLRSCPQCDTLVDFALDGLPSKQQDSVRHHLEKCPSCMEQVRDFWQVREGLGLCAPVCDEPADFNAKVLARLHEQDRPTAAAPPEKSRHLGGWPRFWMTLGPVFAGMSLLMTLVALGAVFNRGAHPVQSGDPVAGELAAMSRDLMNDPHAARVSLVAAAQKAGSQGDLVLCPGRNMAILKAQHLSKCPLGRNYALWCKPHNGGQAQRLARFNVESDGSSLHLLNLSQPWKGDVPVDFMITQDSGPKAGETWLTGSLRL